MSFRHGIFTTESPSALTVPKEANYAIVAIGCAPVNMLEDPSAAVNTPIRVTKATEAMQKLGYCTDFDSYGLCQLMYATANVCVVAPEIYVNVLDPRKHKRPMAAPAVVPVTLLQAEVQVKGLLRDGLEIRAMVPDLDPDADPDVEGASEAAEPLILGVDYTLNYDTDTGYLLIELSPEGAAADAEALVVRGNILDPTMVKASDVIGAVDIATGKATGMEVIRQIYPKLGILPNLLIAPGFSHIPEVGIALAAKADAINTRYKAMALLDLDTEKCRCVDDTKNVKENSGYTTRRAIPMWPEVNVGSYQLTASSVMAPFIAWLDAENGGVPYVSPSNRTIGITGTCLHDGTEVVLDADLAAVADDNGIMTFFNENGWRMWGDYTGAAPSEGDPKDLWICCRRMFDYCENNFLLTFAHMVDRPMSKASLDNIVNTWQNVLNGLVKAGKLAGATVEYNADLNPITNIIAGKVVITVKLAPWTPMREIVGDFSFDLDALQSALAA